jgi:RNA polymerase sigma-70 factor (ECF subfamily)
MRSATVSVWIPAARERELRSRAGNQEAVAALSELRDAYLSLSEEHREVLLLATIEDLQHEEVAAILGVPLATVRARLSLARRALCQALEADRNRHGG